MSGPNLHGPMSPASVVQTCTLHYGVIKSVLDPEGRGRVRVEVPGVYDEGKGNWTDWVERVGIPVGSNNDKGDQGNWWPPMPGQVVLVGFASGHFQDPFCIPGPVWGGDDPYLPADVVNSSDGREITRMWVDKTEAGHTFLRDDNGKREAMFFCDWTGAGWFSRCPGQEEDEDEESCGESKPRKGKKRGGKTVFAGNAPKPSEVIEDGEAITGLLDLNGQGLICFAKDDEGRVALFAGKKPGDINPLILLDAQNNRITLTAGETQLTIEGKLGHIYGTSHIIWNQPLIEVKDTVKGFLKKVKEAFKRYSK